MRTHQCLAISVLMLLFACTHQELAPFRQPSLPVEVVVTIRDEDTHAVASSFSRIRFTEREMELRNIIIKTKERELAAALKDCLATFITTVPEDVILPSNAVQLNIIVDKAEYDFYYTSLDDKIKTGTNLITDVLYVESRVTAAFRNMETFDTNPKAYYAHNIKPSTRVLYNKLGYYPIKYYGTISLGDSQNITSIYSGIMPVKEAIREMKPLKNQEGTASANKEVARAYAAAITKKLQQKFNWQKKTPCL